MSSGEELERRRKLAEEAAARAAAGEQPKGPEYWASLIGGAALSLGFLSFFYWFFDIGTKWRKKVNAIWDSVLDSMCHDYEANKKKKACDKLNARRRWPIEDFGDPPKRS